MININDIIKRSRYINLSSKNQEYDKYHIKSKLLQESNLYRFDDKKFLLQHWESLKENQTDCFKSVIDILDESYNQDNERDFNYIKSYIINEIAPTVRDAKQSARYLKYKTTRMKNKINEKIKQGTDNIKSNTKSAIDNVKDTNTQSVSITNKKLHKKDIHEAYVQILDTLDKYYQCDRILENINTIQKRFNIMRMVEESNINDNASLISLVDSICECINTYNSDFATRFNTTLETCFYFLSRKDKNFNKSLVLEEVVNNFISKDFPESKLIEMRSIIESSIVFDSIDKINIEWIYNTIPFEENTDLAKPFLKSTDSYISDLGSTISNISNDVTDKDIRKVFSSIRSLMSLKGGEVLALCIKDINSLIRKLASLYTGEDFNKLCAEELERAKKKLDNRSMEGYVAQNNYCKLLEKYASKCKISESELIMDFNLYNEAFEKYSNSVKDIINSFKVSKKKKNTDVRTCVSKMFTKSPDQIIDGTPNFLSWVRMSYVLGATALHPILGGITLLIDQFISMKLKRRDVSKMITAFKNERKIVAEKIKKADSDDKKNLKEYDKYLEKGIKKLEEYEESLLSEKETYAKISGEEYDSNSEFDFLKDNLEETSFENLFERSNYFSKEYFNNNIKQYISIMDEDAIDIITDIACRYPCIISTSGLYSILRENLNELKNSDNTNWVRMACLKSNLRKIDLDNSEYIVTSNDTDTEVFDIINGLEDLFAEYSIMSSIKNESVSTGVKMLTNKLRKLMKKASDMDKEASRRIDSSINTFISGVQRASRNENREAIIKGSILPSASKIVKSAILDAGVALINPAIAIILALGQFAISKKSKAKERQFVLDEIDIEIEMCKRYLRQAEDQNDLEAQKKILRIQRNLERQKQRIQYKMKIYWNQDIPNIKNDDE